MAIAATEKVSAARRPSRSPIAPITAPPTGRIRKPTAKMPKAASTCATASSLGEEGPSDRGGEVAVDREIVPFQHVADGAGHYRPARVALLHSSPHPAAARRRRPDFYLGESPNPGDPQGATMAG